MADISAALSDEKNRVRIWLERLDSEVYVDVDATDLSMLIDNLVALRQKMTEEIPFKLEGAPILRNVTDDPPTICGLPNPISERMYVGYRHPGFGWTGFTLTQQGAANFANILARVALQIRPKGGIIRA